MLPVKVHTYVYNVSEEVPQWKWDHEYTEYYNMKDLSPASFDELNNRILHDEDLAIKFTNTLDNNGGKTYIDECDYNCRRELYCAQRNSAYFDQK